MKSITNLLTWINENWASLVTIVILVFGVYSKIRKTYQEWQSKTEAEKQAVIDKAIEDARRAIKEYILAYVSISEIEWATDGVKMGEIKRADVIRKIYADYPILTQVADQDELIEYIDSLINHALKTVREKIRNDNQTA